jgi:hypothetical protein
MTSAVRQWASDISQRQGQRKAVQRQSRRFCSTGSAPTTPASEGRTDMGRTLSRHSNVVGIHQQAGRSSDWDMSGGTRQVLSDSLGTRTLRSSRPSSTSYPTKLGNCIKLSSLSACPNGTGPSRPRHAGAGTSPEKTLRKASKECKNTYPYCSGPRSR